jgi:hypothetical protein
MRLHITNTDLPSADVRIIVIEKGWLSLVDAVQSSDESFSSIACPARLSVYGMPQPR